MKKRCLLIVVDILVALSIFPPFPLHPHNINSKYTNPFIEWGTRDLSYVEIVSKFNNLKNINKIRTYC